MGTPPLRHATINRKLPPVRGQWRTSAAVARACAAPCSSAPWSLRATNPQLKSFRDKLVAAGKPAIRVRAIVFTHAGRGSEKILFLTRADRKMIYLLRTAAAVGKASAISGRMIKLAFEGRKRWLAR
jgi:hypothetical protein